MVTERVNMDDCERFREDRDKVTAARKEGASTLRRIANGLLGAALAAGLAALSWGVSNSVSLAETQVRVKTNSEDIVVIAHKIDTLLEGVRQTMREEFAKDRRGE